MTLKKNAREGGRRTGMLFFTFFPAPIAKIAAFPMFSALAGNSELVLSRASKKFPTCLMIFATGRHAKQTKIASKITPMNTSAIIDTARYTASLPSSSSCV